VTSFIIVHGVVSVLPHFVYCAEEIHISWLYHDNAYHTVKKMFATFPSQAGMSLTKLLFLREVQYMLPVPESGDLFPSREVIFDKVSSCI